MTADGGPIMRVCGWVLVTPFWLLARIAWAVFVILFLIYVELRALTGRECAYTQWSWENIRVEHTRW